MTATIRSFTNVQPEYTAPRTGSGNSGEADNDVHAARTATVAPARAAKIRAAKKATSPNHPLEPLRTVLNRQPRHRIGLGQRDNLVRESSLLSSLGKTTKKGTIRPEIAAK